MADKGVFNKFHWKLYSDSERGKEVISCFETFDFEAIVNKFPMQYQSIEDFLVEFDILENHVIRPEVNSQMTAQEAKELIARIYDEDILLEPLPDKEQTEESNDQVQEETYLSIFGTATEGLPYLSLWLFKKNPERFFPYLFLYKYLEFTQIIDALDIVLPETPKRTQKRERFMYYWEICSAIHEYRTKQDLSPAEMGALFYDYIPEYLKSEKVLDQASTLPKPTQAFFIGGDKSNFDVMDNPGTNESHLWQGNPDTKKGDIIIMYAQSPRSKIVSIWRAHTNGIADPFYYYYGQTYVGDCQFIAPITHKELKDDEYFKDFPLIRKNLQGINGWLLPAEGYNRLIDLLKAKEFDVSTLPRLFAPTFALNKSLRNEREVELVIIEPFIKNLGYNESDWTRHYTLRMGRGEKIYPDYVFFDPAGKDDEQASMLIESKFHIRNNKELEESFKQVRSYGLRLSAAHLLIADKDGIWIYSRVGNIFDRNQFIKKYWKELEVPEEFNRIKKLVGK